MTILSKLLRFALAPLALVSYARTISFLAPKELFSAASRVTSAISVQVADVNNDGVIDVIFIEESFTSSAFVLLGHRDGTFARPTEFYFSGGTGFDRVILTADLNADGNIDIVLGGKRPQFYYGDGSGTFGTAFEIPECPALTAIADLNGDGKPDLVCGPGVLLNLGKAFHSTPSQIQGAPRLLADWSGDGVVDVLVQGADGAIDVALGKGDGSFGDPIRVANIANFLSALTGDFDGDGRLDLLLSGNTADAPAVQVVLGRGDGTFRQLSPISVAAWGAYALADFNGDGKLDILGKNSVVAGKGDGTFHFPVYFAADPSKCNPYMGIPCVSEGAQTVVHDFNGDGLPDLIAAGTYRAISSLRVAYLSVLVNNSPGDGFFATGVSTPTGRLLVAPDSLVTAYGTNLAPATEVATVNPAPTTLGGIRVHIRDRSHVEEWLAPLLYVSPTQINYVLTSSDAYAFVGIERAGKPYVPSAMIVPISNYALDLFTMGDGLAAATAVKVGADGRQSDVPVTACEAAGCRPVPMDLSGDPVYLTLYGTGFSKLLPEATATCQFGTVQVEPVYFGPQLQIAGLAQINVRLPVELQGAGIIRVSCTIGESVSNPVTVQIAGTRQ